MTRIKMHIFKVKLPFYPPSEVKCELQNEVSTNFRLLFGRSHFLSMLILSFLHTHEYVNFRYEISSL